MLFRNDVHLNDAASQAFIIETVTIVGKFRFPNTFQSVNAKHGATLCSLVLFGDCHHRILRMGDRGEDKLCLIITRVCGPVIKLQYLAHRHLCHISIVIDHYEITICILIIYSEHQKRRIPVVIHRLAEFAIVEKLQISYCRSEILIIFLTYIESYLACRNGL